MDHRDVRNVLVLELWNIGDTVLLLPFLQQLRVVFPGSRVVLVARPHARELLAPSGLVDDFIDTDLGWDRSARSWRRGAYPWREIWRVLRAIRRQKFDVAFQCRPHIREHIMLGLSGAKRRVGMSLGPWGRLLTDRVSIDVFGTQKTDAWLRLLDPFGGRREVSAAPLAVAKPAREWADRFLASRAVSTEDLLIAVHPGASVAGKRWPLERFSEVIRVLVARPGVRVLVFLEPGGYGSALEAEDGRIVARVNLGEMVALLEKCDLLVCNDSGPMHIAGALGVPCVAVFSSGIERMFEPLGEGHRLVTPEAVVTTDGGPPGRPVPYDVTQVPTQRVLDAIQAAIG